MAADIVGLDDLLIEHFSFEDDGNYMSFNLHFIPTFDTLGTQFNLFLDAGYRVGHSMITPFRNRRDMTQEEQDWNRYLLSEYISKEWGSLLPICAHLFHHQPNYVHMQNRRTIGHPFLGEN